MGPEANTSVASSPACSAPVADNEKGPGESGVRPNTLTGLLESAALFEDHRTLMGTVLEKISSATSGLNEAFRSLLKVFEVSRKNTQLLVVLHAIHALCIDSTPETVDAS